MTQTGRSRFELLDTRDEPAIAAYEQALYRAFSDSYIKTLDQIWHIDHDAGRIRTRVAYDGQEILVVRQDGEVLAGTAINVDVAGTLQLEMMDFKVDKSEPGTCEALHVFNLDDPLSSLDMMRNMSAFLLQTLTERGMRIIYATCSQKRLRGYQFMGFSVADQHVFKGEKKYLLKLRLGQDARVH